ncbi:hypothetical protein JOC77_002347 [Peribacillus deserti]|uniref:Uncharacterized protein n=1 Tax=Peribacillus deserti TaxID=673318 RepID=A0ABS2QID1_9BACI|nr:hypothetical protein [Peribacillus deserti]
MTKRVGIIGNDKMGFSVIGWAAAKRDLVEFYGEEEI